jgi:hypothetical protein
MPVIIKPTTSRNLSIPIPFSARVYWDVSPDGNVIIGFSEKYEVEIHDPIKGKLSSFSHEYEPVEVTKEDQKQYFAGMVVTRSGGGAQERQQGAPDYIVENTEFPKYKPAFNDIKCDSEGNIWIRTFSNEKKEGIPSFGAFDKAGRFINRVIIEGDRSYPGRAKIKSRSFCIVESNEEGYQKIVRYRIEEVF